MNKRVVGLEIANSSIKAYTNDKQPLYYPNTIRKVDNSDVKKALSTSNTPYYTYKGEKWEVGISNATGTGGKERDYSSKEFETQLAIALSQLVHYEYEEIYIVYGLPATSIDNEEIVKQLQKYVGKYEIIEGVRRRSFEVKAVKVLAQPIGTLFSMVYDIQGNLQNGLDPRKKYLIIDIGWGTTDLVEVSLSSGIGEKDTMNLAMSDYNRMLLELLDKKFQNRNIRNLYYNLYDFDYDIRQGTLNVRGGVIEKKDFFDEIRVVQNELAKKIYDRLNTNGWDFSSYHNIILTGGGGMVLERAIKNTFPKEYRNDILLVDDPVLANAKGFYIFGRKKFQI